MGIGVPRAAGPELKWITRDKEVITTVQVREATIRLTAEKLEKIITDHIRDEYGLHSYRKPSNAQITIDWLARAFAHPAEYAVDINVIVTADSD